VSPPVLTAVTFVRLEANFLRQTRLVAVVSGPFVLLIATYLIAWSLAPNMTAASNHADLVTFFTTSAVVLATILVTLVVQDALFKQPDLRPAVAVGVVYIILGELAATLSALPVNVPGGLERHALALTVSATIGSLAAVLFIAFRRWADQRPHVEVTGDGKGVVRGGAAEATGVAAPRPGGAQLSPGPTAGTRARQPVRIQLDTEAVNDLKRLGTVNRDLLAATLENAIAGDKPPTALPGTGGKKYFVVTIGNVHAIYERPPAVQPGGDATPADDVVILRILTDRDLKGKGKLFETPAEQLLRIQRD